MSESITLIRKNGGNVSAYDDAVLFHSAIGHDFEGTKRGIVFQNVGNQFGFTLSGNNFRVLSGMGMLYGRQFRIPAGQYVDLTLPNTEKYVMIYIEVDATTDPETVAVKSVSSNESIPLNYMNTDICQTESGKATMPLYSMKWSGSAISNMFTDHREIRVPGESESTRSMSRSGVIDGNPVSQLIEEGQTGYVLKAKSADVAISANAIAGVAVNSSLYMSTKNSYIGTFSIVEKAQSGSVTSGTQLTATLEKGAAGQVLMGIFVCGTIVDNGTTLHIGGLVPNGITECWIRNGDLYNMPASAISFQGGTSSDKVHISFSTSGSNVSITIETLVSGIADISLRFIAVKGGV